ncbi:MAG: cation transporter [Anaerolineales bacterium]|nr:cation transporter [Anaerolineales bacterium]
MQKTTFNIQHMDCAAEEQLIRMKLENFKNIAALQFDLPQRKLEVYHTGDYHPIFNEIDQLKLEASFVASGLTDNELPASQKDLERRLLFQVLAINFFFFVLESLMGFFANSMGLVADSLDMLADSLVYGLALFAVGGTLVRKKQIAKISGYFQLTLAIFGVTEVIRRFLGFGEVPVYQTMMGISLLALLGNAASLYLLQKSKNTEAHIQASMIFTSNDVLINIGVILAGGLVLITHSKIPDLAVGTLVFLLVAHGAYRILQISK